MPLVTVARAADYGLELLLGEPDGRQAGGDVVAQARPRTRTYPSDSRTQQVSAARARELPILNNTRLALIHGGLV